MVHISRIEQNLSSFIDNELTPQMPRLEGLAFAAVAPFVIRARLPGLMRMIQGTELTGGEAGENVDIDALYRAIKAKSNGKWPIELAGFKFYETDLDKLYAYLQK
jgi:hypothetical protein